MKSENKLDRSFRDRLRDFEAAPDEQAWARLEAALRERKKRRVLPIWWRLSGVAAALILATALYYAFFKHTETPQGQVVEQHPASEERVPAVPGHADKTTRENVVPLGQAVANENEPAGKPAQSSHDQNEGNDGEVAHKPLRKPDFKNGAPGPDAKLPSAVVSVESLPEGRAGSQDQTEKLRQRGPHGNMRHRNVQPSDAVAAEEKSFQPGRGADRKQEILRKYNDAVAENAPAGRSAIHRTRVKKEVAASEKSTEKDLPPANANGNADGLKNAAVPMPASQQIAAGDDGPAHVAPIAPKEYSHTDNGPMPETKKDSAAIATAAPNSLEELLHEKEKQVTATGQKADRWQVTPSVAPIYFSSASNGSPLDSRFEKNKKSYTPSLSYGVGAKYAVSKKLAVRAGVHALKLEYNTGDLVFAQTANARKLENVSPNLQGSLIEIDNKPAQASLFGRSNDSYGGQVTQKIGYVEIPVEVSYKLVDRKFAIELIGGVSTLVLNDNQVLLLSEGLQMPIGEASNLNRIHFSSNVGVGLRYNFLKSFQASVDPMLKYQIGTFSDGAGNFKPYFLGLYTGLSYRF